MKRTITTFLSGVVLKTLIFHGVSLHAASIDNSYNGNERIFTSSPAEIVKRTAEDDTTAIYTIQGTGSASTLAGTSVTTKGVVTGVYSNTDQLKGFFLQDTLGDNLTTTSDGIFVLDSTSTVSTGDFLYLSGTVSEEGGITHLINVEILEKTAEGISLKDTLDVTPNLFSGLEAYEGMLVRIAETLYVTDVNNVAKEGEITLSAFNILKAPTDTLDPNDANPSGVTFSGNSNVAAVNALTQANSLNQILLDDNSRTLYPSEISYFDPATSTIRIGSSTTDLVGIVDYNNGKFKIQTLEPAVFVYTARPAVPQFPNTTVKVASFNLHNFFNGNGDEDEFLPNRGALNFTEFQTQREKIVIALSKLDADIIGLLEVENDGDTSLSAIEDLASYLNEFLGDSIYSFVKDPEGVNGNPGTDAIKQSILYKHKVVQPQGPSVADNSSINTRPSIAQLFKQVNAPADSFVVVVSHFKSKLCDNATGNNADAQDGQGCYNADRVGQSEALAEFVTKLQTATETNEVLVVGDFNAYSQEDPIDALLSSGLKKAGNIRNTYSYSGQHGTFDHAFTTAELEDNVTGGAAWNINASEPDILDYREIHSLNYVLPDEFRSSDHDPIIIGLNFSIPTGTFKRNSKAGLVIAPTVTEESVSVIWESAKSSNAMISIKNSLNVEVKTLSVKSIDGKNQQMISVKDLAAGMYVIDVICGGEILSNRFVVVK